ncbi:hypothetical protein [Variovorax ginsengisoli]|uniref:Uncharacterized protein n=1 Tax=Variovorax ginsengisoli TaxID=363844 RepID=A0ABT8SD86_9BURK|nr:hypothetical protein [Variovorax ginsengisoli]MDN8617706.1 hypothetical protein [Variovorax ginsengisoli]MDO1536876.1 hypothetical protein [Variovorax ginsengisoli]
MYHCEKALNAKPEQLGNPRQWPRAVVDVVHGKFPADAVHNLSERRALADETPMHGPPIDAKLLRHLLDRAFARRQQHQGWQHS